MNNLKKEVIDLIMKFEEVSICKLIEIESSNARIIPERYYAFNQQNNAITNNRLDL